jgi:serine/threonine-protein kinase
MGQVWSATHTITQRAVAIKIPLENRSPEVEVMLFREARLASMVDHPGVVGIHDAFELDDGTPVVVMELLHGETLGALLARRGSLSLPEAARVIVPLMSVVAAVHASGIVHCDLKPDNVFLVEARGCTTVKLLDFGIATMPTERECATWEGHGLLAGTPRYMAPEQMFGDRGLDQRVDVWAIGAMLYEILVGRSPVEGDSLAQITRHIFFDRIAPIGALAPGLPRDVQVLVDRMLAPDRAHRLSYLHEARYVLSAYCDADSLEMDARQQLHCA